MSEADVPRADEAAAEAANVEKLMELLGQGQMLLERAQRTLAEAERVSIETADALAKPIAAPASSGEETSPAAAPGRASGPIEFPYLPASPPPPPIPPLSGD